MQSSKFYELKSRQFVIASLSITVPPEKLVIVDEKGAERTSVVGPYSEGADLALRCDVYGGKYMCRVLHYCIMQNTLGYRVLHI
jgi:hypothetical protein